MKKKVLLIMPNYYGFDEVVIDGLKKHSNCKVFNINYDVGFTYANIFQRVDNAFSKVFLGKNKKPFLKEEFFFRQVSKLKKISCLLVNRPDIIPPSILNKALEIADVSKLLLWDSLEKIPIPKEIWHKFDQVYSFDQKDCEKYGFNRINNFHFYDAGEAPTEITNDAMFLGTVDDRMADLQKIIDHLATNGVRAHAYLHIPRERELSYHQNITVLKKIVPFNQSDIFAKSTRVIIDLAHKNQLGLSFRIYEAMALRKKIITTNVHVREYDFFNEKNIWVIDDIDSIQIPYGFFEDDYVSLNDDLVEKYSVKSWVEKILN